MLYIYFTVHQYDQIDESSLDKVVYNLLISKVEWKCEGDTDLAPYVHEKEVNSKNTCTCMYIYSYISS
jgi:hypothetical protein